jgi:organic hydroperoxide reductase OsmC/OhrA
MSSEHRINLFWKRITPDFSYETYDRTHAIRFEGGQVLPSSAAPDYLGRSEFANPEEMLVAALSSCHMLTFLAIAAKSRVVIDKYEDQAVAELTKNADGKLAITKVTLRPLIIVAAGQGDLSERLTHFHEKAHANCFIANSVKCEVTVQPRGETTTAFA